MELSGILEKDVLKKVVEDLRKSRKRIKELIKSGLNINEQDNDGWTALIAATWNGDIESIKLLINAGADINIQTKLGWTALKCASLKGFIEIIELLEKGDK